MRHGTQLLLRPARRHAVPATDERQAGLARGARVPARRLRVHHTACDPRDASGRRARRVTTLTALPSFEMAEIYRLEIDQWRDEGTLSCPPVQSPVLTVLWATLQRL